MEWNPNTNPDAPTYTGTPRNATKGIETRLIFGRSIPHGPQLGETVTDYSVRAFLDSFVLPRFPSGFTVTESRGVWKGGQEDSFAVSVIYTNTPLVTKKFGVRLEEIRAEYIRIFHQESVLRIDTPVTYSFD